MTDSPVIQDVPAAKRLRRELIAQLAAQGKMPSEWRDAFEIVPRHAFVPHIFISPANDGWYEPLDGTSPQHRARWLETAYSDDICVTQLDGSDEAWNRAVRNGKVQGQERTCSSSQPSLMALMLNILDVSPGHNVLEIGTGTGYNAALLCERLGSDKVTSVDTDPELVQRAGAILTALGYTPTLAARDGAEGYPPNAPYDRVIATCSFPRVPDTWLSQTRPGAVILVNLYRSLGGGILARLTVNDDGSAHGQIVSDTGGFMPTRAESHPKAFTLFQRVSANHGDTRPTTMTPDMLHNSHARAFIALLCDDMTELWSQPEAGPQQYWVLAQDGSWARHEEGHVTQAGPRHLWDQLESAYTQWTTLGRPTRDRLGLTIQPARQIVWLDRPTAPLADD
jgi:methyltransferase of ATP-grasp peptide maturase system